MLKGALCLLVPQSAVLLLIACVSIAPRSGYVLFLLIQGKGSGYVVCSAELCKGCTQPCKPCFDCSAMKATS